MVNQKDLFGSKTGRRDMGFTGEIIVSKGRLEESCGGTGRGNKVLIV